MSIGAKPWEGGGAASVPDASETTKGKIRIATSAEATTGTDDLTAMTPLTVKERIDAALVGGVEYKGSYTGQSLVTAEQGDMYISAATYSLAGVSLLSGDHIIFNQDAANPVTSAMFDKIDNTDAVSSVNTLTGAVVLSGDDIAADHSASNYTPANANIDGHLSGIDDELLLKAPLASPSLTGTPTAPTATQGDNSTKLATTAYVDTAVSGAGGNQITDVVSQTGSSFTATANEIYICGYSTGTQTITFPDASSSTDGDLIGLTSVTTTEFTVDLVSSDGTTNDLLNMSNQTKGGTNGAITLTLKQELILFACDGTRWRQLSRELADVAKTGAYSDLSGTPTLVTDLDGLSDVTITSAASGNLLEHNGSGQFVNVAKSAINVGDFNDDSTYQPLDAQLTDVAGLTPADGAFIVGDGANFVAESGATARTSLGLTIGTDVQAYDAQLDDVAGLTPADGAFIVGDGANFVTESLATARTSLGLGTAATSNTGDFLASTATLNDISDVTITSVSNGQVISYNSTSGEWENSTPASGGATDLDGLSDVTITSASSGQILRNNGSGQFVNVALSIVDDTTPQLGGALDVNGNAITSASNGNVTINPDGTGDISVGADIIPDADATHTIGDEANRFISLYSDVNGAIRFKAKNDQGAAISKGQVVYIKGVSGTVPTVGLARANSSSTMPAFGLALDNANDQAEVQIITFGNLTDYNTTTYSLSANDTVFVSAATAGALTNSAPTGEANLIQNIGRVVRADASAGIIKVGGAGRSNATPNLDQDKIFLGNASNQAVSTALSSINLTSFNDDLGSTYQPLDAQLTDVAGLTPADGAFIVGDGANFVTESGATARTSLGAIAEVSEDTTPQLGGPLDVNGQAITSASNGNVEITPNGTGAIKLGGNTNPAEVRFYDEAGTNYVALKAPADASISADETFTLPAADGTNGQVLQTNGSGVLSFVDQSGGGGGYSVTVDTTTIATTSPTTLSSPSDNEEVYIISNGSTDVTVNLVAAATCGSGFKYTFKVLGSGSITLDPNSTEYIDHSGQTTYTPAQYDAVSLITDGSNWFLV